MRAQPRKRWTLLVAIVALVATFAWLPSRSVRPVAAATIQAPGPIALGDTVTGNAAVDGTIDTYSLFVATPGATVIVGATDNECGCRLSFAGPSGTETDQALTDFGPRWLAPGAYTLTITSATAGTYGFRVLAAPDPQSFTTAIGATVGNGVPLAGAGNIESPGAQDTYTFSVPAGGANVGLRVLNDSCGCEWSLRLVNGPPVFERTPIASTRVGLAVGSYSLRVSGGGASVGTYSFTTNTAPAPDRFVVALGDPIADGTPGPGAGNLETSGAVDVYAFAATGGARVAISGTDCASSPSYALAAPSGRVLLNDAVCGTTAVVDLPAEAGSYEVRVAAGIDATGTYALAITESSDDPTVTLPIAEVFAYAVGSTVTDGVPGPGAGNIETPGAHDEYEIDGTAGATVVFDDQTSGGCAALVWSASLPDGAPLAVDQALGCPTSRAIRLPQTGRYTIDVHGIDDATGTYSFVVRTVPARQSFAIALGATISNGVPAIGAGNLNLVGAVDVYTFTATRGQSVVLADTTPGGCAPIDAVMLASDDSQSSTQLGCAQPLTVVVQRSGVHTVIVTARGDATGTYSFRIKASPIGATAITPAAREGAVKLTWTAPATPTGSPITNAQISVFNASGGKPVGVSGPPARMVGSAVKAYTFTGLTNGTSYTFVIREQSAEGLGIPTARSVAMAPAKNTRPNILFILTDDQRYDAVAQLPKLNAMPNWYRFSNSFVNEPLCCPSRATIISGRYSHHTNVQELFQGHNFDDRTTDATMLHAVGYHTGFLGKYMFGYPFKSGPVPPGWDDFEAYKGASDYYDYSVLRNGQLVTYGSTAADYSTDVWTDRANNFIRNADPAKPFFLEVAYNAPHFPIIPAPRDIDSCLDQSYPLPASFNAHDAISEPPWLAAEPDRPPELEQYYRRRTCETLKAVDDGVVSLMNLLTSLGRLSNTYVVLMSDNGLAFGEHSLVGKGDLFDESIRVPLMIRGPGIAGGTTTRLTSNVDLVPSFLALAKTAPPANFVDGVSWAANALGSATGATNPGEVLLRGCRGIEFCGGDEPSPMGLNWGLRTATYKYVEYPGGYRQLFDLVHDPHELRNLATDPSTAAIRANLHARLVARRGW